MPSRTLAFRVAALVLAALLSLTGSGASIAHGIAHDREHRAADHHDGTGHHDADRVAALAEVAHADGDHDDDHGGHETHAPLVPLVDAMLDALRIGAPDEPAPHPHARLDALAVTRLAIAAFLPAVPVLVPAPPVIAATVQAPPAATPLRLAEPPTGPPPPSRAPPLG